MQFKDLKPGVKLEGADITVLDPKDIVFLQDYDINVAAYSKAELIRKNMIEPDIEVPPEGSTVYVLVNGVWEIRVSAGYINSNGELKCYLSGRICGTTIFLHGCQTERPEL